MPILENHKQIPNRSNDMTVCVVCHKCNLMNLKFFVVFCIFIKKQQTNRQTNERQCVEATRLAGWLANSDFVGQFFIFYCILKRKKRRKTINKLFLIYNAFMVQISFCVSVDILNTLKIDTHLLIFIFYFIYKW